MATTIILYFNAKHRLTKQVPIEKGSYNFAGMWLVATENRLNV